MRSWKDNQKATSRGSEILGPGHVSRLLCLSIGAVTARW
jgi:hypothetical protein